MRAGSLYSMYLVVVLTRRPSADRATLVASVVRGLKKPLLALLFLVIAGRVREERRQWRGEGRNQAAEAALLVLRGRRLRYKAGAWGTVSILWR